MDRTIRLPTMRLRRAGKKIAAPTSRSIRIHPAEADRPMADLFKIRSEVSPRARLALAIGSWTVLVSVWYAITHFGLVPPFSLPNPKGVVQSFVRLWTEYDLLQNVFQSWWRIAQAFLLCDVIAIQLGLLVV